MATGQLRLGLLGDYQVLGEGDVFGGRLQQRLRQIRLLHHLQRRAGELLGLDPVQSEVLRVHHLGRL